MNNKFKKSCQRIAVCLYGQYRSGDYLLPYFKQMSEQTDCQVDFFCSTKEINYYNFSKSAQDQAWGTNYVNSEIIKNKIIDNGINAKLINIIPAYIDDHFAELDIERNGLFYTMADSINLKAKYEHDNGFVYDMVLLTRYDALITPINILTHLKQWYNTVDELSFEKTFNHHVMNNWLITHKISMPYANGIQDIVNIGSSVTMDMISTELSQIIKSNLNPSSTKTMMSHRMCGHTGLYHAIHSAGISCSSNLGRIDLTNNRYNFESHKSKYTIPGLQYTLIRESWDVESLIKKVPFDSPQSRDFYRNIWLSDIINQ